MGNFNRGGRSGGRGFERRGFNDRSSRGPVEMHQAVCDNCRKECEVPFRPTSGKPVFCSNCFEGNRGSDSRRPEGRGFERSEDRQMFEAICDECRNSCKVPFQPSSGKPVYCSNCFGDKKGNGDRNREQFQSQPQCKEQFEQLNNKLDRILAMLTPKEAKYQQPGEQDVVEEKVKVAKKKPSKKKQQ